MTAQYQNFITKQNGSHHHLIDIVEKHAETAYLRPIPTHQQAAFAKIMQFAKAIDRPLIIDSGCGTGLSTRKLAERYPDHGVIGIDKSVARLERAPSTNLTNCLLVRGDVIDLWRLLAFEQLPITHHYLLFPNPWPKAEHVKRRFYAHPVFHTMVHLAPYFELRTNWQIYADECVIALRILGQQPEIRTKTDSDYMTLFEKKYLEASCPVYLVTNHLNETTKANTKSP